MSQLGSFIEKKRIALGLSGAALAKKAAISATWLSLIERGLRRPPKSGEVMARIAVAIGVSKESLVRRYGKPAAVAVRKKPVPRPRRAK